MRTRNKDSIHASVSYPSGQGYTEFGTPCNGGAQFGGNATYGSSASFVPSYAWETMQDETGKGISHPVIHRKYLQECLVPGGSNMWSYSAPAPLGSVISTNDGGRKNHSSAASSYNTFAAWSRTDKSTMPPYWVDSTPAWNESGVRNELLDRAAQLKADVLLNLVEANQIVPSVQSLVYSMPKMAKNWKSIRKVIRTASGGYLAWKFGISPILSDIMAINRFIPKARHALERHGNMEAVRYSKAIPLTLVQTPSPYANGYNPINGVNTYAWEWTGGPLDKPSEIRYVLVVRPNTKYHTDFFKKADGLMSRFVTSPASLAWEKIPFSFVIDWFVDLRATLGALDRVVGFSPYQIVAFTRSKQYHLTTHATLRGFSCCNGGVIFQVSSDHEYQHYERSIVSAQGFLPVWKPRVGKNQAAISVALISQMLTSIGTTRAVSASVRRFNNAINNKLYGSAK